MPQQAAPGVGRHRHAAEIRTVDVGDAVVLRQPLVHERVVRVEQIQHRAVLAQHALEQQLRFPLERLAQVVVEVREHGDVGVGVLQLPEKEPLVGEVGDQRPRLRVGQHPARLLLEHGRLVQLAVDRQLQQLVVRNRRPQEEGEP